MTWRSVKTSCLLLAFAAGLPGLSYADSSASQRRDKALKGIESCLRRNELSSRECKSLNKNVQTLVEVYRQGDKTVLPTLLHFTYLSDFYAQALISDPEGFLTAVSHLSESDQHEVAVGIAGGLDILSRPQFDAVRTTLLAVPDTSPNYRLARTSLATLETENAVFLVQYFPPQIFTNLAGRLLIPWFSRELYALREKPLWPPRAGNDRVYRITIAPSFTSPRSVTLTVYADGSGYIRFQSLDSWREHVSEESSGPLGKQQVEEFESLVTGARFWQLSTEAPQQGYGLDGAQWLMEGVQGDEYHAVLRWCPAGTPFGEAARRLFNLAGHKVEGSC
jgi:hypothetical protein